MTLNVVDAELFSGAISGLLVVSVVVAERVVPAGAVTWPITVTTNVLVAGRSTKFTLAVPPSVVPGGTQAGKQETSVNPTGRAIDIVGLSAGPVTA